ncbi:hypothetical protein MMC28_008733 [Mycoblastus sanguinarius]|nr:hypothetical protein [Mycoblastus sanguinarius]
MATASSLSNVSNISGTPAAAQPSGWATKQDWTRHEDLIRRLYEQRTLPDLMQEMRRKHDFKATIKMYKMRIKQWGLHKNRIQSKIRARARENKPGVTYQKRSLTHSDDSNAGCEDVIRHEKRRRMTDNVREHFTPIPSPIVMPGLLGISESIFCGLRDYYKGSFERGIWVSGTQELGCYSIKFAKDTPKYLYALLDQCRLACRLFANNHCQEAGQALISATAGVKKILEAEHPKTLSLLFELLLRCQREQRREIALTILRHFSDFGELLFGNVHPLGRIFGWLALVDELHFEEVVSRCLRSASEHFEINLGPMHRSTLDSRLRYIESIYRHHDINQKEVLQQNLLEMCERTLGAQDIRILEIRSWLAFRHFERKDYAKAIEMGEVILAYAHQAEISFLQCSLRSRVHYVLANSQYKLRKPGLAKANLREAIAIREREWGIHDYYVIFWSETLEKWRFEHYSFELW